MSNTRTGKIAKLPKFVRNELGQRIENGVPGVELVEWLNSRLDVKDVLKEYFDGRAINQQNLTEWKQGGHLEWLRNEDTRLLVCQLTEQSNDLDEAGEGQQISDRFAGILAIEFTKIATLLLKEEADPEKRWQCLCRIHREFSQLRRDDHRAVRTQIKRERWDRQVESEERESDKKAEKEHRERMTAPFWAKLRLGSMAELFGGGDIGHDIAAFILEMQNGLEFESLGRKRPDTWQSPETKSGTSNQTESNQIRPNQTNFEEKKDAQHN